MKKDEAKQLADQAIKSRIRHQTQAGLGYAIEIKPHSRGGFQSGSELQILPTLLLLLS